MASVAQTISYRCRKFASEQSGRQGFTLIELLVVISVISLLMGIMLPSFATIRTKARTMINTNNQREIAGAVNLFAMDNDDRYPQSVATVGFGSNWNWSDPMKLTGNRRRSPALHRSMSSYLGSYVTNAGIMFCLNAPRKYKYLQQAWDAGDEWDNPETPFPSDPVGGTYCFYWNYLGYLGGQRGVFIGPHGPTGSTRESKLLVTDYFGYDHWRSRGAFGSCERFKGADIIPETWLLSAYWSREGSPDIDMPDIRLQAGYTDGHVESYFPSEVVPMRVSITSDGTTPYPDGVGPGIFYLPINALP